MKPSIRSIIGLILTVVAAYLSFQIINDSKGRQQIVVENAEVKNIRYGLLSVHAWKRQVSEIITKKVREFELTTENRRELKGAIQDALYQLLDEVERVLAKKRNEGGFLKRALTGIIQSLVFDLDDLRRRVPEFTKIILEELDNYETREKLRAFIQKKIDDLFYKTVGEEDRSNIQRIAQKYGCTDIPDCSPLLQAKLDEADLALAHKSWIILALAILAFLAILISNNNITPIEYAVLILLCGVLLYGGVSTPMIDIDARIDNFQFQLFGEPLTFSDQILFFQSKSILEVVNILLSTGEYQSVIVGGMIFLFSIVFPVSKLIASLAILVKEKLYNHRLVHFLALRSGKWSMADVVVVAIFMAYIGFKGVIQNQLLQIESISEKLEILTTDKSNFGVGFALFLAFCIGGLVLATILENRSLAKFKM